MASKRIVKTPGTCGGAARIDGTRIAVWVLVEARRLGRSDESILLDYPHLIKADLTAAFAYAAQNEAEIERLIWQNDACMVEHDGRTVPEELIQRGKELGLSDEEIRETFEPPLDRQTFDLLRHAAGT